MNMWLFGDSVPKPLGFTAFPPEWLFSLGRLAPPRHSGRWVGARVASLRSPILRPGEASINRVARQWTTQPKTILPKVSPVRQNYGCPGRAQLAGFEVTPEGLEPDLDGKDLQILQHQPTGLKFVIATDLDVDGKSLSYGVVCASRAIRCNHDAHIIALLVVLRLIKTIARRSPGS